MLAYYLSQCFSIFLLQGSLPQMLALPMEPYAMIQVSILLSLINLWNSGIGRRRELWMRISSQAISISFNGATGSHSWNPGWKTL